MLYLRNNLPVLNIRLSQELLWVPFCIVSFLSIETPYSIHKLPPIIDSITQWETPSSGHTPSEHSQSTHTISYSAFWPQSQCNPLRCWDWATVQPWTDATKKTQIQFWWQHWIIKIFVMIHLMYSGLEAHVKFRWISHKICRLTEFSKSSQHRRNALIFFQNLFTTQGVKL